MVRFKFVSSAPETLNKGEYVIDKPSFLEEIRANKSKAPRSSTTTNHYLRSLLEAIANKYDPNMNPYKIPIVNYEGIEYSSDEDLDNILVRMLWKEYPQIFPKYLDHKIKSRPRDTKLIFYVDSKIKEVYEVFEGNGVFELTEQEEESKKSKPVKASLSKQTTPA